jgi:hypothetical protein
MQREIQFSGLRENTAAKLAEANARCLELQKETIKLKARISILERLANHS